MTYRSDYNPAIDKSVEAGMLLRSTIDEVFSTDAFTFWYMRKWNIYVEDRSALNLEAYIACVNKEEGIEVSDRLDVIRALSRSVTKGYRELTSPSFNGNKSYANSISISDKNELQEDSGADYEEYMTKNLAVSQPEDMTFERINSFIKCRDPLLYEYLNLQLRGYSGREAAHKMGYTNTKGFYEKRNRFRYLNGDKIKKIIL